MRKTGANLFLRMILILGLLCGVSWAQENQSKKEANTKKEKSPFGLSLSTTFSSNFYKWSSTKNQSDITQEIITSYTPNKDISLTGYLAATKDLKNERKLSVGASFLNTKYNLGSYFDKSLLASLHGRLYFPSNKTNRRNNTFRLGIMAYPSITYNLEKIGIPGTTFTYRPRYRKNIHKYHFTYSGAANSSHQVSHYFVLGNQITEKLSISNAYIYIQSWTYGGSRKEDQFYLENSIGYQLSKNVSISLAHSLNEGIYGPDGVSNNIRLFSERASTYSLGFGISL